MVVNRPKTKILVDGGDSEETRKIKSLVSSMAKPRTQRSLLKTLPFANSFFLGGG
jgi:hypothetical protein